jgi:parallel beta-helix repeat protein
MFSLKFLFTFALFVHHVSCSIDFYISTTGNDANTGTSISTPWATPFPSTSAITSLKSSEGILPDNVNVHFASGVYFLSDTFNITAEGGGDIAGHTVTYSGPSDPTQLPAVISAGELVVSEWTAVSGASGVFSAPLPTSGTSSRLIMIRQMWDAVTGARQTFARTPVMFASMAGDWGVKFTDFPTPADVPSLAEAELVLWHNWVSSQNKIREVNFTNFTIGVIGEAGDPFFGAGGTFRWALQNVANVTTLASGSFFVSQRVIYYRPISGLQPTSNSMIVEGLPEAITLTGANATSPVYNVILANLTVAHSAATLETSCMSEGCGGQSCSESTMAAIHMHYVSMCLLTGIELYGTGQYSVWFDEGSVMSGISESWIHDMGMGAVRVGNGDDTGSVTTSPVHSISVMDCTIEDGGKIVPAGTGILAQEAYNTTITHNHVHHLFYTGIATGWTWGYMADSDGAQTVGFNHIHDIFQNELSDGGCIYNLGRSPGTLIVNNLCHDVNSYGYGGWGLYTDEGSSNVTIKDNVVYNTKDAGFHQHYGTDNVIINNIIAYPSTLPCNSEIHQCDVAAVRSSQHMDCWNPTNPTHEDGCNSSFAFIRNIVLLDREQLSENSTTTNATTWVYSSFTAYDQPKINSLANMTFSSNTYWSVAFTDPLSSLFFGTPYMRENFSEWVKVFHDDGSVVLDPQFVNPSARNFTLLPTSPSLALGFEQIDVSTVGPRIPFRRS